MKGGKYAVLRCVTGVNNNKYYIMEQVSQTHFEVRYGREGGHETTRTYPMGRWSSIYRGKTRSSKKPKPYRDVTEFESVEADTSGSAANVSSRVVSGILHRLQQLARGHISRNYRVAAKAVTQAQVDEAQSILNGLAGIIRIGVDQGSFQRVDDVNQLLIDLYHVIPRKMDHVQDYLLHDRLDTIRSQRLLTSEQDNLDVMAQQVQAHDRVDDDADDKDMLDAMGVLVGDASSSDVIGHALDSENRRRIRGVYAITNQFTQKRFDERVKQLAKSSGMSESSVIKHLFHGSRNENWLFIIDKGLLIKPTGVVTTGSMFGNGIYFADKMQKSIGYSSTRGSYYTDGMSDTGFIALYSVLTGRQLSIRRHEYDCYNLTLTELHRRGKYDSVFAPRGADLINNEYIIYSPDQCTITHLIEVA